MPASQAPQLTGSYFDGSSACARAVTVQLQGSNLLIRGIDIERSIALRDVQWPERTRHGKRVAHFRTGGSVQCANAAAWDAWSQASGRRESLVVKIQQSWRGVLASTMALVVLLITVQQWGVPAAAHAVAALIPASVDTALGAASLEAIDEHLMRPSKLPTDQQDRLRTALAQAASALPAGSLPPWQLVFRKSRIGPNAFALPGGTLVMTDELVELVGGDAKVLTAVLAHELGHVQQRHGLHMLVQTTTLSALAAVVLGDFSAVLASLPVLLGQASYSRKAEHEADVAAVSILRAAAISPDVMVTLFERLEEKRRKLDAGEKPGPLQDSWLGIAFASHPADADRIRFFKEAAAGR